MFVQWLAGWHDQQAVQAQLRQRRLRQRHMAPMRRVKSAAKDAEALGDWSQTQSLRTKNSSYRAASGVPAAGIFW